MAVLSDFDLWSYINSKRLLVEPFKNEIVRENGLDLRIGDEIARLKKTKKIFDSESSNYEDFFKMEKGDSFIINPHEHVLLYTIEYLNLPEDLMGFVNLRSTFARTGLIVPPTIVDANFEGQLTIEVVGSEFPVKINVGDRFLHVVFSKLTSPVEKPYIGKYQGQTGVQLPLFKKEK